MTAPAQFAVLTGSGGFLPVAPLSGRELMSRMLTALDRYVGNPKGARFDTETLRILTEAEPSFPTLLAKKGEQLTFRGVPVVPVAACSAVRMRECREGIRP